MTRRKMGSLLGLLAGMSACHEPTPQAERAVESAAEPLPEPGPMRVPLNFPESAPESTPGSSFSPRPKRLAGAKQLAKAPPAISGGTLTLTQGGEYAVASDSDRDAVYVVHLADKQVRRVPLPSGSEPGRVAVDGAGRAHVVLRGGGKIAQVDIATATLVKQQSVCAFPRGVALREATESVYVSCASGELVSLSARTYQEQRRTYVDRDLRDVAFDKRGKLFVSRYRSAELIELDPEGQVMRRHAPYPSQSTRFRVDAKPGEAAFENVNMTPTLAWRMVASSQGDLMVLHQRAMEEEVSLAGAGGYGGNLCGGIVQTTVSTMDESGMQGPGSPLSEAVLAVDVAATSDGRWLAVAAPGNHLLGFRGGALMYRSWSAQPDALWRAQADSDAGVSDTAVDVSDTAADGGLNQHGRCDGMAMEAGLDAQVVAVAFTPDDRLVIQSREPAQLEIVNPWKLVDGVPHLGLLRDPSGVRGEIIPLDETSMRDTGHELFHANVGAGISCASCHGEAMDDAHVWSFEGIGPRRTQTMRGALMGTQPFHWDGDMKTFQHLVDEVMTRRMGGFDVLQSEAKALASWIDKQPALVAPARDDALAARGKVLFESEEVGCASCHSGPLLTNNQAADVGTGKSFQVPSLLGLAMRASYMHDGCARTLHERFEPACGGGDAHGKTSQLTPSQIDDLVGYLESL